MEGGAPARRSGGYYSRCLDQRWRRQVHHCRYALRDSSRPAMATKWNLIESEKEIDVFRLSWICQFWFLSGKFIADNTLGSIVVSIHSNGFCICGYNASSCYWNVAVAVNLAGAHAKRCGLKVGLLDADIYGTSVPTMTKITDKLEVTEGMVFTYFDSHCGEVWHSRDQRVVGQPHFVALFTFPNSFSTQ